MTTASSDSSPTTSPYFGDCTSSCRTLDNVCVLPTLPKAPFSPQGRLHALQHLLVRWQTEVSFFCTPRNLNLLSCGRIKRSCFRSVHSTTGRAASPADMYQYKGDGRKAGARRHCDWRMHSNKGVSELQNVVSDNTKHISSCKSDVQLPLLVFFFWAKLQLISLLNSNSVQTVWSK